MHARAAKHRLWRVVAAASLCAALHGLVAHAQADPKPAADDDLLFPPRLESSTPATRSRISAADPAPSPIDMEEVLVVGEQQWRLPDLGSEWRAQQTEAARNDDRIKVELLPLFDPASLRPERDLFLVNTEMRRVGYIEIFRLRFGRR
jgi:hypothetical protein